jgi:DNA ligase (NAD+)
MPNICPICNGDVLRILNEAEYKCQNVSCSAKIKGSIQHYVSKPCMNIEGIGEKLIELLLVNNLIKNFSDLYNLKSIDISALDRMGEKSANNIINAVNNSKSTSLNRFINGLGINHIGQNAAKNLASFFNNDINLLINASKEELLNINEIGEIMADSLIKFFDDGENLKIINNCITSGLIFKEIQINTSTAIYNKKFVFTGNLQSMKRSEASRLIEKFGAKSVNSVSKNTSFVVAGDSAGSKLKKALELDVKVLNERDFLKIIDEINE